MASLSVIFSILRLTSVRVTGLVQAFAQRPWSDFRLLIVSHKVEAVYSWRAKYEPQIVVDVLPQGVYSQFSFTEQNVCSIHWRSMSKGRCCERSMSLR